MTLDQIESFLHVVHYKSVHKAAEALFLSQPTVSARIKSLEKELQTDLFKRNGKRLELTVKGKAFIPYAQQMNDCYEKSLIAMTGKKEQNEISIGATPIITNYFLPDLIAAIKLKFPKQQVRIISAEDAILHERLYNGSIQIAFTHNRYDNGTLNKPIFNNPYVFVTADEMKKQLSIEQLASESFILFEENRQEEQKLVQLLSKNVSIVMKTDQVEVVKSLVRAQQGVGFVPYVSVKKDIEEHRLFEISMTNTFDFSSQIIMNYNSNIMLPNNFVEVIELAVAQNQIVAV